METMRTTEVDTTRGTMTHYRWVICALLVTATTINYMDRQILALLKDTLEVDLHWSNKQYGLVNSTFQAAYAVGLLSFGWLVDRFGTKIGYAISIVAWSLAAMAHAAVGSVTGFVVVRAALGLGEGGNFPTGIKTIALWFPKRQRAFATSFFNSGANLGPIIAPACVPWIVAIYGHWQAPFILAGIIGFLWLFYWMTRYDTPERQTRANAAELQFIRSDSGDADSDTTKVPWLAVLKYRQAWAFFVGKFLTDPIWWFFLIWLPDYFNKTRGLDISKSWLHLVLIYSITTVLSVFGGWISGHLIKNGWSITKARKLGMFVPALCVVPILCVSRSGNWTAVLLISLACAGHQAWSANLFTSVSDIFPKTAVASIIGIGGMFGSIGGMIFPLFCGWLLDYFHAAAATATAPATATSAAATQAAAFTAASTTAYAIMFGICSFGYLAAFVINHILAPKFEPISMSDE